MTNILFYKEAYRERTSFLECEAETFTKSSGEGNVGYVLVVSLWGGKSSGVSLINDRCCATNVRGQIRSGEQKPGIT